MQRRKFGREFKIEAVRLPEVDWRGFRVSWVYTTDDDLFVRPQAVPSRESLSWEPQALTDA